MAHTAQELYRFAMSSPGVQFGLSKSFRTLARHKDNGTFSTELALEMLLKNNVRDAARYFVQHYGGSLKWQCEFAMHEREGCAALFLRQFDGWYSDRNWSIKDGTLGTSIHPPYGGA